MWITGPARPQVLGKACCRALYLCARPRARARMCACVRARACVGVGGRERSERRSNGEVSRSRLPRPAPPAGRGWEPSAARGQPPTHTRAQPGGGGGEDGDVTPCRPRGPPPARLRVEGAHGHTKPGGGGGGGKADGGWGGTRVGRKPGRRAAGASLWRVTRPVVFPPPPRTPERSWTSEIHPSSNA